MNLADVYYRRVAIWIGGIGIAAFLGSVFGYWAALHGPGLSTRSVDWGTFGDFVGGFAGTVIALATLLAIVFTLHLQARELAEARTQLSQQMILTREYEARRVRPMIKGDWIPLKPGEPRYAWRLRNVGLGPAVIDREEISVPSRCTRSHGVEDIEMSAHWKEVLSEATKGAPPGRVQQTSKFYPMKGMNRILAVGEEHKLVEVTFSGEEPQMGIVLLYGVSIVVAFRSLAGDKLDTHTQLSVL